MLEILKTLKDTPLPIVLVIGGLIFLLIPFIQKISSKEVGVETANQSFAGIIGFVLLVTGIGLYIIVPSGATASIPPTAIPPVVVPPTESQSSQSQPTIVVVQPTTALQVNPTAFPYCYGSGTCWEYNTSAQTMTWTGAPDGAEDIWQAAGEPLEKIRGGFTAIITTTVPGEIFACILSVDGNIIKKSCDGVLYQISAGTYKITSASNSVGGFRWCPAVGYGYRADGSGVCK